MTPSKSSGWIAGTAFVGILILVAAWFVAIAPVLATASDTRAQASSERDQSELTKLKIARLKVQFAKLDGLKAEVAAIQLQIPTSYDLANYQRQVSTIALAHSVTVTMMQISSASPVVPVVSAAAAAQASAAAAAAAATKSGATSEAVATSGAAAPVTSTGIEGFYSMSVSLEIIGSYANGLAFLQDLQAGTQRLLLVGGLTGTAQDQTAGANGSPGTNQGDLDLVVSGSLYVLADPTATVTTPVTPATPPALPVPDPNRNPLAPLG